MLTNLGMVFSNKFFYIKKKKLEAHMKKRKLFTSLICLLIAFNIAFLNAKQLNPCHDFGNTLLLLDNSSLPDPVEE